MDQNGDKNSGIDDCKPIINRKQHPPPTDVTSLSIHQNVPRTQSELWAEPDSEILLTGVYDVTNCSMMTSLPCAMTSLPSDMTSDMTSPPSTMASLPSTMSSLPSDMTSPPSDEPVLFLSYFLEDSKQDASSVVNVEDLYDDCLSTRELAVCLCFVVQVLVLTDLLLPFINILVPQH